MADGGAHALSWNRVVHTHQATTSCQLEGQEPGGEAGLVCCGEDVTGCAF